jgi:beta-lactam-binding protein with PASTA domain
MLINYLSYYLVFIIIVSILFGLLALKKKFLAPRFVIPIFLFIVLLPVPAIYFYVTYFTAIPEVAVPDLTGVEVEEAREKLTSLKLKFFHGGQIYNMEYPEGIIVSQRPEAGRKVKIGRTVNFLTSSGKMKAEVPDLLGRPQVQAEAVLSAKGLSLGEVEKKYDPELNNGIILEQAPLPGEEVEVGALVDITIASNDRVLMPNDFEEKEIKKEEVKEGKKEKEAKEEKEDKGGFWPWW